MTSFDPTPAGTLDLFSSSGEGSTIDRLAESRILMLTGELTDDMAHRLCARLLLLDAVDPATRIRIYIDCLSGSVGGALALHDTISAIGPEVETIVLGSAASVGRFVLSSGQAGRRFALPHARIERTRAAGGFATGSPDSRMLADQIDVITHRLYQEVPPGGTRPGFANRQDGDESIARWMNADDAVREGLIDGIMRSTVSRD